MTCRAQRFVAIALIGVLVTVVSPTPSLAVEWQWIAPQRLNALLKEGSGLLLVDVRSQGAFASGHIEGAMAIPCDTLVAKRLPKRKIVVLVDDSLGLRKGREGAKTLVEKGQEKVFLLQGGLVAWQGEGYPVTGKGPTFKSVMPEEIAWAYEHKIRLRVLDLRDQEEQVQGPVKQAENIPGKTVAERLATVVEMLQSENKGLAAKLDEPITKVLVLPMAVDARQVLEHSLKGAIGDVRYLTGASALWAARPDKNLIGSRGGCPTCPGIARGGNK